MPTSRFAAAVSGCRREFVMALARVRIEFDLLPESPQGGWSLQLSPNPFTARAS
jgi:hypothetical protein